MSSPRRSLGRFVALGLVATSAVLTGLAAPAAAAPPPATAALDWLEGELADDGGHLTTSYAYGSDVYSYDDWGLTLDAALALAAGGRGGDPAATTALAQVADHVADYVTGASFGAPDDRYAAALAKSLFAAAALGADPSAFGGMDLVAELTARMQTAGSDAGRFSDRSDWGDFSNGIGQALAVLGLARTPAGVPAPAVEFLLAQQCPGGGFRGDYSTTGGCTASDDSTVDATGFALQALVAVEPTCAVRAAIAGGVGWLEASQNQTGGFGAESGNNTNSTGLAAQALRVLGRDGAADAAAGFITSLQLVDGDDAGAIALNQAGLDAAADGIQTLERDGFRRATGQAALGLGVAAYSELGAAPIDASALTPCAATPVTVPVGSDAGSGPAEVLGAGATAGSGATLPATGRALGLAAASGLSLVAAGMTLTAVARRRVAHD